MKFNFLKKSYLRKTNPFVTFNFLFRRTDSSSVPWPFKRFIMIKDYRSIFCLILLFLQTACKSEKESDASERGRIHQVLNQWHLAAAEARFDDYFNAMTKDAIFIGTDASEHWDNGAFRAFCKPYFDRGKAWSFQAIQRHIYFNSNYSTAWFDELLTTQMKLCRGSGVLQKVNGQWKIAHYVLSMTIPNALSHQVTENKDALETAQCDSIQKIAKEERFH